MKNRINQLRKEKGLTLLELANRLGVTESTVQRYESGNIKNLKYETIIDLSEIFECSPGYLMGWENSRDSSFEKIPVFSSVSAGEGAFADGNIEGYTDIPLKMAQKGEYFGLRVDGDSMEPEIMHHDIIIVHKGMVPRDGQIVAAIVNGNEGFCKRFIRHENGIGLMSNNSAYKPIIFTFEEVENIPVTILGTVERVIREYI